MVDVLRCRCMFRCQEGLNQQERHGRITSEAIKCVGTTDPLHENLVQCIRAVQLSSTTKMMFQRNSLSRGM